MTILYPDSRCYCTQDVWCFSKIVDSYCCDGLKQRGVINSFLIYWGAQHHYFLLMWNAWVHQSILESSQTSIQKLKVNNRLIKVLKQAGVVYNSETIKIIISLVCIKHSRDITCFTIAAFSSPFYWSAIRGGWPYIIAIWRYQEFIIKVRGRV